MGCKVFLESIKVKRQVAFPALKIGLDSIPRIVPHLLSPQLFQPIRSESLAMAIDRLLNYGAEPFFQVDQITEARSLPWPAQSHLNGLARVIRKLSGRKHAFDMHFS